MSPAAALLTGQKAALEASAALGAAFAVAAGRKPRVFDAVPTNAVLPYAVLGDGDLEFDDSDDCNDACEIVSQIGLWLKPEPPNAQAVRDAVAAAKAAVFGPLALEGFTVTEWTGWRVQYVTDPDGSTHAAISIRYLIDPA